MLGLYARGEVDDKDRLLTLADVPDALEDLALAVLALCGLHENDFQCPRGNLRTNPPPRRLSLRPGGLHAILGKRSLRRQVAQLLR